MLSRKTTAEKKESARINLLVIGGGGEIAANNPPTRPRTADKHESQLVRRWRTLVNFVGARVVDRKHKSVPSGHNIGLVRLGRVEGGWR